MNPCRARPVADTTPHRRHVATVADQEKFNAWAHGEDTLRGLDEIENTFVVCQGAYKKHNFCTRLNSKGAPRVGAGPILESLCIAAVQDCHASAFRGAHLGRPLTEVVTECDHARRVLESPPGKMARAKTRRAHRSEPMAPTTTGTPNFLPSMTAAHPSGYNQ